MQDIVQRALESVYTERGAGLLMERGAMKVKIKDFDVDMEVKNRGIEFEVRSTDGANHLGDLVLSRAALIWCPGRTTRENGMRVTWDRFIEMMQARGA